MGEGSPTCMMLLSPSPSCPGDADAAAAPPAEAPIWLERRCPRARPPSPPPPPPFPPPGMLGARREECSATNATGGPAAVPPGAFALVPGVTGAAPGGDLAGGAPAEVEPSPRPSRASRASKRSSSCADFEGGVRFRSCLRSWCVGANAGGLCLAIRSCFSLRRGPASPPAPCARSVHAAPCSGGHYPGPGGRASARPEPDPPRAPSSSRARARATHLAAAAETVDGAA